MQWIFAAELLFVMFLFLINGGKSLNCFVCRSDEDHGCSSNVNKSYSVACPAKNNSTKMYCRVILQKLIFKNQKDTVKIRECAYEKGPRSCYYYKWVELAYQETCECDSDLCNRGFTIVPDIRIFTVTFFLWVLIFLTKR